MFVNLIVVFEPSLNIASVCSIKKRVQQFRENMAGFDENYKMNYHQKYGNYTKFFERG
jgi:hypothetical protein